MDLIQLSLTQVFSPSHEFRRRALQKIATLSKTHATKKAGQSDLIRLCEACPSKKILSAKAQTFGQVNGVRNEAKTLSEAPMVTWL